MADKIPLRLPYTHSLLLPRLRTVFDITGWPTDAYGMVIKSRSAPRPGFDPEKLIDRKLPAVPKTLRKPLVSPRIARRVFRELWRVIGPMKLSRLRDRWLADRAALAGMTTWNEMAWRSTVRGW